MRPSYGDFILEQERKERKKRRMVILTVVLVLVLIIVGVGVALFLKKDGFHFDFKSLFPEKEVMETVEDTEKRVFYTQEELDDLFAYFDDHQMQAAVHCIGDRAMDMVIEAIAKSPNRTGNPKNRHGLVHVQITNPRILENMKKHDILAYIQPVFVDLDMGIVEAQVGPQRMDKVYAWKTMLDMGIHTSGGSDAPVVSFDVMENIYFAVTRKDINGQPEEGWIPSEKMSVDEAVKLFTKYAAYASYTEDENGTIEPGKWADMVVLEKDIYEIDPDAIKDTKIDMTILAGKVVYERQ